MRSKKREAGRWVRSNRPEGSYFLEAESHNASARVRPVRDGFEWSIWVGPENRRVMYNQDIVLTRAGAKRVAERLLEEYWY